MRNFDLSSDKAINSLLYIINSLDKADTHKVYKILYFADQKHLIQYGRPIIGDTYMKMQYGPVPSYVKNIVDENIDDYKEHVAKYNRFYLKSLVEPDLDHLSESDLECINESIQENRDLNFDQLTSKSHDDAYEKASWDMDYNDIALASGASKDMLSYIRQQMINDNIELV